MTLILRRIESGRSGARRSLALVILVSVVVACGNEGAQQIHDAATLPKHISVCGRTWIKDALGRASSLAEIRALLGLEPLVVDPGFLAPCPPGPCTTVAQDGPCHTVVYVRVGEDAYLDYELSGGP